jgi:hypothetical protein
MREQALLAAVRKQERQKKKKARVPVRVGAAEFTD